MAKQLKTFGSYLIVAALTTTFFILVASLLPQIVDQQRSFASYLEIESIIAEDITLDDSTQDATIVYNANEDLPVTTIRQLTLVSVDDETERVVYPTNKDLLFEQEQNELNLRQLIPDNIPIGNYQWAYGFTLDANGNRKTEAHRSNTFRITQN